MSMMHRHRSSNAQETGKMICPDQQLFQMDSSPSVLHLQSADYLITIHEGFDPCRKRKYVKLNRNATLESIYYDALTDVKINPHGDMFTVSAKCQQNSNSWTWTSPRLYLSDAEKVQNYLLTWGQPNDM
jgi:hypothetical protein